MEECYNYEKQKKENVTKNGNNSIVLGFNCNAIVARQYFKGN